MYSDAKLWALLGFSEVKYFFNCLCSTFGSFFNWQNFVGKEIMYLDWQWIVLYL